MLDKLFTQLYEKLKTEKENDKKSKNGYFDFFVNVILKNDAYKTKKFSITAKAIKNYYEKYVEKKENKSGEPKSELKNLVSKYLEFEDYSDFVNSNKEITTIPSPNQIIQETKEKTFIEKYKNHILGTSTILFFSIIFFIIKNNKNLETCIYWAEDHFEKSACEENNTIDNSTYNINIEKFRKVEVTNETSFFINGNPQIWYGKSASGKIEFFTQRGVHPETLKELNKITEHIINKYIFTDIVDKTILN